MPGYTSTLTRKLAYLDDPMFVDLPRRLGNELFAKLLVVRVVF